jgi:predicted amidohydrolase
VKVAAIQHDIVWEDAEATHQHVAPLIADAAEQGARLIVLSEMFATGFSMQPERIAEPEGGASEQFLLAQAQEHNAYVLASIAQRGRDGLYRNNAVLAAPDGSVAARYAKIHPFSYAREHEHYAAGTAFCTAVVDDVRVSVFVCYDLRFADEFWALARETDLYVVPANWPEARREHWNALLRARAIENQAYVLGVNRVGADGNGYPHAGDSAIIDPLGVVMAAPAPGAEQVVIADVSADVVAATRKRFPFLADRR